MKNTLLLDEIEIRILTQKVYQNYNKDQSSSNEFEILFMCGRMAISKCKWDEAIKWFGKANAISIEKLQNENFELLYWTGIAYYNLNDFDKVEIIAERLRRLQKFVSEDLLANLELLVHNIYKKNNNEFTK